MVNMIMRFIRWINECRKDARQHPNTHHHTIAGKDINTHH